MVVTAAYVGPTEFDKEFYLHCDPLLRKLKLDLRGQPLDKKRAEQFEIFDMVDTLLFGFQQLQADVIVDTSQIHY